MSHATPAGPMTVVGPQFTAPRPMDLIMTKKFGPDLDSFVVTDVNANQILKVEEKGIFRRRIFLIDNAGTSIVSLHRKIFSFSGRWKVYRGDSSDPKDLLFTIKESPFFQYNNRLNVFLADNTIQKEPDFIVKPISFGFSCTIYLGDSSTIIAQMHQKNSFKTTIKGKEILEVTVSPNIDYAFIVSLVLALYDRSRWNRAGGGASG